MMRIHPTALIEAGAQVAPTARIGAYCVVGSGAVIGENVRLHSHVVVAGNTTIGAGCQVFPFASLGHAPQDLKYGGEESFVVVGENTTIREHVTINSGTAGGGLYTRVGSNCLLMVGVHIAHDCVVEDGVIMANNATLAGHVHIAARAVIGGLSAIHQHVRIGTMAMVGGMSGVEKDVLPYTSVLGNRATVAGMNVVGLKRAGVSHESRHALRHLLQELKNSGTLVATAASVATEDAVCREVLQFITQPSKRGFCALERVDGEV